MEISVQFKELNKTIDSSISENREHWNAGFGETTTIHDGQNGATFIPSVSDEGIISWTNDRDLTNPPPVNIKGRDGKDGYTPVAGTDYYTEAEREAIVSDVLNILVGTMKAAKIGTITLLADSWTGSDKVYSQVVSVEGVTEYSQVDITPSIEQLAVFYEKDVTFVTENEDGVVTVYAIGQKPTNDYTIQVTITEVSI
jgi:hypothetical protein